MTEALEVLFLGRGMGSVERTHGGRLSFSYDDAYRLAADATPLSLSMSLTQAVHPHPTIEAFLWGLLPDNSSVLDRWGRDFHVSPRNSFALLRHVGRDCAGAAEFVERGTGRDEVVEIDWLEEAHIAAHLRRLNREPTAWHLSADSGQFSLAGAQAKVALLHEDGRWGRPRGRRPTSHILKPAVSGFDDHDLNEHLCLALARRLGITAVRTRVVEFEDTRAIVVERYDRLRDARDGHWQRVHQEDMCQALSVMPERKYQAEGGPGPRDIVSLLRRVQPRHEARMSVQGFVDALALNWLIGGTDAHAKNYSLLLSGSAVRLAPLYDVASALPYPRLDVHRAKLAMKVGGEYRLREISRRHWERESKELGVDREELVHRLADLAARIPDELSAVCADPALKALDSALPARLTDAVSEHASRCARILTLPTPA